MSASTARPVPDLPLVKAVFGLNDDRLASNPDRLPSADCDWQPRAVCSPFVSDVTEILSAIESGDPSAAEQLLPLVYDELRKLAAAKKWPRLFQCWACSTSTRRR